MREKISGWFVALARAINPKPKEEQPWQADNYKAEKFGLTICCTKKNIKDNRRKLRLNKGLSARKADEMLIREIKAEIRQSIFNAILRQRMIEYTVEETGDETHVTGYLLMFHKERTGMAGSINETGK